MSGVVSAGLSTTVLPAASAGAIFHASISSGKFHGMICPATPSGRGRAVRERVLELVGPARVVEEVRGRERQVDVARLLDRLAAVQRLEHGELARALLRGCARSGTGTSRARCRAASTTAPNASRAAATARATSASARLRDLGERLLVARRDRREVLARARLEPLAADEEAVALAAARRCRATRARARTSSRPAPASGRAALRDAQSFVK